MNTSNKDKIYPVAKIAMIVDLLAEEGIPAEEALAGVSLSPGQLRLPATKVSTAQVLRACYNAFKLSRDRQFPYSAGSRFCVSTYGLYGFAALSSPNFRETIAFAVAYHRLATPLMQVDFREEEQVASWIVTPLPSLEIDERLYEFVIKLHMAVLLSLHRKMIGPAFKPALVDYALGQPHDDEDGAAFFGCPVFYGKPENRFAFDVAWLDRRPDFGNETVHAELKQLCDCMLKEFEQSAGIAGEVRKLIFSSLSRPVAFEHVAKCLNMSERSLRRRLQEEPPFGNSPTRCASNSPSNTSAIPTSASRTSLSRWASATLPRSAAGRISPRTNIARRRRAPGARVWPPPGSNAVSWLHEARLRVFTDWPDFSRFWPIPPLQVARPDR